MTDTLSGQINLAGLFDSSAAPALISSLTLRGEDVARNADTLCAVMGSPSFRDGSIIGTSRRAGFSAELLQVWREVGVEVVARIRGSYALVIVDGARGCVFLAVDRFATETLCYRTDGKTLAFSDRADCVSGRSDELDPQSVFDYLYFHMIPAPRTIFSDVRRLPAAHSVLLDRRGVHEARHWPLLFDERRQQAFADARDTFRNLIRENVAAEVAGHQRVGSFLSGGTDSSTVAGVLCQVTGRAAPAYSIGFDAEGYDEMAYARIAAKHFGCEHHEYYVTPADLLASIPAVAQHFDQPFGNSSALPAYYCAKIASSDGCTKILAGDGGDELFGGNSRYAMQRLFEFYHAVPKGVRRLIEPMCDDHSPLRRIPGLKQATGYVRHSRVPMPDRLQSFNLIMQLDPASVLSADFLARIDLSEPSRHMQSTWSECQAPSLINRMLAYDWRYTLADSDLPKVRGATRMAGIEVGYPLLADALTDFSMALPPDWKLRRFKLRWFFKEALRGFLPDAIITKKKKGFGLPFGLWTTRTPALRQLVEDSLGTLATRGIIRADFIQKLMSEYLPAHPGYYGEMAWILTMFEQWLRNQETG
ncbi:MAG: asparagine synthase C-terminal domain-containing protein [Candidatus Accumulibacter phosphatis]|uniref:asparagine synthase (glutamine-hydrolyzing) n=2 Tax=Candidatus Accumulibacter TaxID=327159 RepID=A0A080MAW5_9PROT|nr:MULTISPECIES: asparagine synthase C-terminal domain-containing protein [Candidatus Accumulibacter]KFB78096.1 MAG: Asparagine synthetase [glutamine-hydrolyzing] 1 [Candidatus Accumulibacter cognatus]MBL8402845.1 asparagine synthase [Accumulibacter sp.]MBN8516334.1 asparagine synthase [Accumulibacter sp.]MBO3711991.1 asparagine synthase [Accumulibacter sp.]MCC2867133.1 asparagine synthase C-terminal domain-containing protein [Candidatus Accumulibacter phosphatis]